MSKLKPEIRCPHCKHGNEIGVLECINCGKRLELPMDDGRPMAAGGIRRPSLPSRIARRVYELFKKHE